ncbi:MAG: deoxyribose-phosphate aldolase [Bacteroidales bacterium]
MISELAKMIDHAILHPALTDADLERECRIALKYNVASVCVKPYMVKKAAELLRGSSVLVGCVIGFPAGNSTIAVKVYETETAVNDGAEEIDMVINIGRALSGNWEYIEREIELVTKACHNKGAIVKVIFETDYITNDDDKIRLCQICTDAGADYVKTSTGFGFVKDKDGKFFYNGATIHDLKLMRSNSGKNVKVKASGGISTLDQLLEVREAGCSRCGASGTAQIMEEALKRFAE